jgi:hypothetical protein
MSAYITLATPMVDRECLLEALAALGFGQERVEVHETPAVLHGYGGVRRGTAEVILRKQHQGAGALADIGFQRTATGFQAIVDQDDRVHGTPWLKQLHAQYEVHSRRKQERLAEAERQRLAEQRRQVVEAQRQAIHEKARKMGYRVQETREGDKLRLVLVKRVY